MGKKLIYLDENPQICCENCLHDGADCNANMLYGTCLSRGFCKWQGAIDPDEDFCYSEFEPDFTHRVAFLPVEMTEVPKDFLRHVYDEAFKAGANGMQERFAGSIRSILDMEGIPTKLDVDKFYKALITYRPEFVIQE